MADDKEREILLLQLMHIVADTFKDTAVLKGGMYLRLLKSKRMTQDIDYVFKTKESRKIIASRLKQAVEREGISIKDTRLNSRGIIMRVEKNETLAMIEISIADKLNCPTEKTTTSALADQYEMSPRVITVMSLAESYAHKIAASLERSTMRDLYDLSIYQPLTPFDQPTLKKRLSSLQVNRGKKEAIDFQEAASRLEKRLSELTPESLEKELFGLIPDEFMHGGATIIKNCVSRLCQELKALNSNSPPTPDTAHY
jgi:predicted nucleotidyltransferase component of viral defense system